MVTPSVPPQRLPVNLVRSGRKQPQREHCVPGCGWWGCLHNAQAFVRKVCQFSTIPIISLIDIDRCFLLSGFWPGQGSRVLEQIRLASADRAPVAGRLDQYSTNRRQWGCVQIASQANERQREAWSGLYRQARFLLFMTASRLGQGLVNRCDQLSQILRGGSMYDTEQIRSLFVFIAHVGKKGFQLHIQHVGK